MDIRQILDDVAGEIARDAATIEADADAKEEGLAPGPFGVAVALADGGTYRAGAADTRFAIQSIAKVFALECALAAVGDDVFDRVGREPSGDPFNSIVDLERTKGIPRNPFINAGALAVVDQLVDGGRADAVMQAVARRIGVPVVLDEDVMASEHDGGDLNRALMSFMRHHDNLRAPIDDVMASYVRQCAISLDCGLLATAGLFLAETRGKGDAARRMRTVLALMMTCGHYDASGDFAVRVGLPAKSGVGGGILAVVPGVGAVATWSPNLDQHGNSMLGVRGLEMIADRAGWSVFGG
ncbi:hypothetical protein ASG29_14935 [Sphingomonas sp. Leaf412]|nr:hypothetical protein ASG29_14935 [Sphingomonas sp. Leaf412]